ncbi:MAG: hypothetical protein ACPGO3_05940 [Magnetospiraceae bacterium]
MSGQSTVKSLPETSTHCFFVHAPSDPGLMPAVCSVLAKRGLVPSRLYATAIGAKGEEMQIDLQVSGLEDTDAEGVAQSLRRLVYVGTVLRSVK